MDSMPATIDSPSHVPITAIAEAARRTGTTIAVAESLTGGLLANAFAAAPEASEWFRGGIVAYAAEVKHDLLGTPPGPVVTPETARAMATAAARLLGADIGVGVTGVGGPGSEEGQPPGTVYIAVAKGDAVSDTAVTLHGDPASVVAATVRAALDATSAAMSDSMPSR